MKIFELRNWIDTLSEEEQLFDIAVVLNVSAIENSVDNKYITKHEPLVAVMLDSAGKEACFFNLRNAEKIKGPKGGRNDA